MFSVVNKAASDDKNKERLQTTCARQPPDMNNNDKSFRSKIQEISEAYEILSEQR